MLHFDILFFYHWDDFAGRTPFFAQPERPMDMSNRARLIEKLHSSLHKSVISYGNFSKLKIYGVSRPTKSQPEKLKTCFPNGFKNDTTARTKPLVDNSVGGTVAGDVKSKKQKNSERTHTADAFQDMKNVKKTPFPKFGTLLRTEATHPD